jgi:hypothetical protein
MKRKLLLITLGIFLALAWSGAATHLALAGDEPQEASPVLCLPDIYQDAPADCAPEGPSSYLTRMGEHGITQLPLLPLQASQPPRQLTNINTRYGQVVTPNAPVFNSLAAAQEYNMDHVVRRIDAPFSFISYNEEAVVDGARYYKIAGGQWMTSRDISRLGAVPMFQGLTFSETPRHTFGWVLGILSSGAVETKRTPGYEIKDYTGHILKHHELVQVYAVQQVGDVEWYMVGPDEWLHQRLVARIVPNPTPHPAVQGSRWIEVNLFEQTIAVYEHGQLVFGTLMASGKSPYLTRPGVFQIYSKLPTTPMRGAFTADRSDAYYLEDVPWTMYYDEARAFHGAYWRTQLGYPQSKGCINLSVGDSRWLYEWAQDGDWVYVWDPSGQTPTDPELYGSGGA